MWSAILVIAVAAVDQVAKVLVQNAVPGGASFPVLGGVFHITHVQNPGSAFNVFATGTVPIIVTTLLIASWAALARSRRHLSLGTAFQTGTALVLGGAIGNLVDRVRVGHVIDFIDLRFWPVFNLADAAITVGALVLVYGVMQRRPGGRSSR